MTTGYTSEHLVNGYTTTAPAGAFTNGAQASRPMDGRQGDYQPGLTLPDQQPVEHLSEGQLADQASAAQYTPQQDIKYNPTATPTSDYTLNPSSARSGTFPDYPGGPRSAGYPDGSSRHPQYPSSAPPNGAANMAQPPSPSISSPDEQPDNNHQETNDACSDPNIPVDPSIAQSSPTYPPHNYSPYGPPPHHDMNQHYQTPMYRPDYAPGPYSAPHMSYGHVATSVNPPSAYAPSTQQLYAQYNQAYTYYPPQNGHPLSTVYSFVPIPGTHQQKRPRRRYEEIERMYKCGWNGCEKAYGTLNHLNAHVTMQSHGAKRTPEEFKEIRKEWKARKKEEDNARKADDERQRAQVQQQQPHPQDGHSSSGDGTPQHQHPPQGGYNQGPRQLPPLGYAPASGQIPPQYAQAQAGMDGMPQYPGGQIPYGSGGYPPQSPYGQPNQM